MKHTTAQKNGCAAEGYAQVCAGVHTPAQAQHTNAHAQRNAKTPYVEFATCSNGRVYRTRARTYTYDQLRAIVSEKQKKGLVCANIWVTRHWMDDGMVYTYHVVFDGYKWHYVPQGLLPIGHPSDHYRMATRGARE